MPPYKVEISPELSEEIEGVLQALEIKPITVDQQVVFNSTNISY